MIGKTLMIFGPGGIGKSPLDSIIRTDVLRIDPYRLRPTGPRDKADMFYAHEKLHTELTYSFKHLGDKCEAISQNPIVEWFPISQTAFFDVRGEWQCLILGGLSASHAKAEIYAPAVPIMFSRSDIKTIFGKLFFIILNPADPLQTQSNDFSTLKTKTVENCLKRGDTSQSIEKRKNSIDEEAIAWRAMLNLGGIEFPNWDFPEYIYKNDKVATLRAARSKLIEGNTSLVEFLKPEVEIQ